MTTRLFRDSYLTFIDKYLVGMPIYFKKETHEYNIDTIETVLEESIENATQDYFWETGDSMQIEYEIDLDDSEPYRVKGDLTISYEDTEDKVNVELKTSRSDMFKMEYLGATMPEESRAVFGYLEDNIDSMLELDKVEEEKRFKTTQLSKWRS